MMENTGYCWQCGAPVEENASFCSHCGRRLDGQESEQDKSVDFVTGEIQTEERIPEQIQPPFGQNEMNFAPPKPKSDFSKRLSIILAAVFALACVILIAVSVTMYNDMAHYRSQAWQSESTIENLEDENEKLQSAKDAAESQKNQAQKQYNAIKDEYEFYHKFAVVYNSKKNAYYHQYGCSYLDTSSFLIYNIDAAKYHDLQPCPYCMKD